MARRFGFTPQQCAEMTPAQVVALLAQTPEEAQNHAEGKMTLTFAQARQLYSGG